MWKLQPALSLLAWWRAFFLLPLASLGCVTFCSALQILSSAPARRGLSSHLSFVQVYAMEAQKFICPLTLVWPEETEERCCGRVSSRCWVFTAVAGCKPALCWTHPSCVHIDVWVLLWTYGLVLNSRGKWREMPQAERWLLWGPGIATFFTHSSNWLIDQVRRMTLGFTKLCFCLQGAEQCLFWLEDGRTVSGTCQGEEERGVDQRED